MQNYEKTCRIHGVLSQENITAEPTARATRGYVLRCRLCRVDSCNRQYEKRRIREDRKRNTMWEAGERVCQIHGELKEEDLIVNKSSKNKSGVQVRCRKCVIETNWNTKFAREAKNTKEITRVHKLTLKDYERMFKNQGNVCKICKQPETRKSRRQGETCRLVVDHCHSTLQVRGLLCHACNLLISYARESKDILQAAIRYLKAN